MYAYVVDFGELQQVVNETFDQAIVYHGYTDYMRDYEVIFYMTANARTKVPPPHVRYLFRHCVEATCETTVKPETWRVSLDERLISNLDEAAGLNGFVWGARWQDNYPGATIVENSPAANRWNNAVGIDFHEVRFETNAHKLSLVFSELTVTELPAGYVPFQVSDR